MFEPLNTNFMVTIMPVACTNYAIHHRAATSLFNQARWNATLSRAKSAVLHCKNCLLDLKMIPMRQVRSQRYGGIKPVNLDQICGSQGRSNDFDSCFLPRSDRLRERWVSVAMARALNVPLPPVELIQVGSRYFVKDGHHRISVARVLGEAVIDAEIVIWEVCCPLPWEAQPAAPIVSQTFTATV